MATRTRAQATEIEYRLAPWHLRLHWWVLACWWSWRSGCEASGAESPEQINPLWWR